MISGDTVVTYLRIGLLTRHSHGNIEENHEVLKSGSSAENRIECVVIWWQ